MEKKRKNTKKIRRLDSVLASTVQGRVLSMDFFAKHWMKVFMVLLMFFIYISDRYKCLTLMEDVNSLQQNLEILETERIRVKSSYMSKIRETSISKMVDDMNLNLSVQECPPFKIVYSYEED